MDQTSSLRLRARRRIGFGAFARRRASSREGSRPT